MRQELLHHANRPAQIDFNLSSDVFEASSFVVNIDLTHDAGVVDQNVELRKLFDDLFVKNGDRFGMETVAWKGVNLWKGCFRSDFSDQKAIAILYEEVIKQFPELNILINNAGIMREINIHDKAGSLEDITREIEINLSEPIRLVKQFLPHLNTKSEAAIMNVSSGLAFDPLPISPVYCATKAGLHSFTESLRVQLKNTKVKVFELAPPATQTELLADFSSEDMKGVSIMKVEEMVKVAVKGMQADRFEIRPGQANQLKMMSRVEPGFILKQMSRSVDRMLGTPN